MMMMMMKVMKHEDTCDINLLLFILFYYFLILFVCYVIPGVTKTRIDLLFKECIQMFVCVCV